MHLMRFCQRLLPHYSHLVEINPPTGQKVSFDPLGGNAPKWRLFKINLISSQTKCIYSFYDAIWIELNTMKPSKFVLEWPEKALPLFLDTHIATFCRLLGTTPVLHSHSDDPGTHLEKSTYENCALWFQRYVNSAFVNVVYVCNFVIS